LKNTTVDEHEIYNGNFTKGANYPSEHYDTPSCTRRDYQGRRIELVPDPLRCPALVTLTVRPHRERIQYEATEINDGFFIFLFFESHRELHAVVRELFVKIKKD
jgi:hypothetical protein